MKGLWYGMKVNGYGMGDFFLVEEVKHFKCQLDEEVH